MAIRTPRHGSRDHTGYVVPDEVVHPVRRAPNGFAGAPTDVLLTMRANLLSGLELDAAANDAGKLDVPYGPKSTTPRVAAGIRVDLLEQVDEVLIERGVEPIRVGA